MADLDSLLKHLGSQNGLTLANPKRWFMWKPVPRLSFFEALELFSSVILAWLRQRFLVVWGESGQVSDFVCMFQSVGETEFWPCFSHFECAGFVWTSKIAVDSFSRGCSSSLVTGTDNVCADGPEELKTMRRGAAQLI